MSDPAATDRTWEPVYDWWVKTAYRGAKKPTASQEIDRMQQFLKMVKKCECGEWHLEFDSKCRKCEQIVIGAVGGPKSNTSA